MTIILGGTASAVFVAGFVLFVALMLAIISRVSGELTTTQGEKFPVLGPAHFLLYITLTVGSCAFLITAGVPGILAVLFSLFVLLLDIAYSSMASIANKGEKKSALGADQPRIIVRSKDHLDNSTPPAA